MSQRAIEEFMTSNPSKRGEPPGGAEGDRSCLLQVVAGAMKSEPRLEAVRIDRERESLAVATIGVADEPAVAAALSARIEALRRAEEEPACGLLAGTDDCTHCPAGGDAVAGPRLEVHQEGSAVTVARVTCPTAPRFWRWRERPLPRLAPRSVAFSGEEDYDREWRQQLLAAVLCGALGVIGWASAAWEASWAFYLAAYVAGSWFTVPEIRARFRTGVLDIHFLMLAVAVGSASIGAWNEGAVLLFLFSLSGALEHYAMGRTQREIRSLFRAAPKEAIRLDDLGRECPTPVESLQPGMILRIRPGEQFPVDAELVKGETASDESTLTGESTPVEKQVGDTVLAGTLNLWGSVEVVVLRRASESALQKVIRLIQQAQHLKAPAQRFTDRFSTGYTYGVLGLSLGMFLWWWLGAKLPPWVSTTDQASAFYRAMTLLVVASPCALVLSIPSAVLAAIAWAARRGVLFRGGAAVERLAAIHVVAMDKTGTLTTGDLEVERVESLPPGREAEVLQWACSLEQHSNHPLARAIVRHGKQHTVPLLPVEGFQSTNGLGLNGWIGGVEVWLGRRGWIERETGQSAGDPNGPEGPAHSEVWLWSAGLKGRLTLRDDVRPEARELVERLEACGLQVVVLTGDRREAAEALRHHAGLTDIRSGLRPEDKVAVIQEYARRGLGVAMIGDGVNDAPSLAAADVGVAMGARGADAALEQAEVVLMHDRLENFLAAYQLSQRARAIIRQNLTISLGTVGLLVLLALGGSIPLTIGVIGHEGSTVLVVLNSLRLLLQGDHKGTYLKPPGRKK
jgi:Zn2+/Cd2+-exporting ATPase